MLLAIGIELRTSSGQYNLTNISTRFGEGLIFEIIETLISRKPLKMSKNIEDLVNLKRWLQMTLHYLKMLVHCATKFGSCLVLGVLTVGLYSLVIKTTETAFFFAVKIRLGSGEFFF